jgi:rhamnosyltransferase
MALQFEPSVSTARMELSLPSLVHTCAVVVTYNPQLSLLDNISALAPQVNHVVLVDNGSSSEADRLLLESETRLHCTVIRNRQNLGIAAALNRGIKYAIEGNYDWIVTFDQDSCVSDRYIPEMFESYREASNPENIALIAPTCVDRETGIPIRLLRSRKGAVLLAMTSGSMIPCKVIQTAGEFDESLFMDYVDVEFCLRLRRLGMRILESPAVLFHALGRTTYHEFLGAGFGVTNHSAARRYYITRNRLLLLRRYFADWSWSSREGRSMLLDAAKILLLENDKREKFRAMAAGTADALLGKVGKQIEL